MSLNAGRSLTKVVVSLLTDISHPGPRLFSDPSGPTQGCSGLGSPPLVGVPAAWDTSDSCCPPETGETYLLHSTSPLGQNTSDGRFTQPSYCLAAEHSHPEGDLTLIKQLLPHLPLCSPQQLLICFLCLWISLFWTCHIHGIIQYVTFHVWLSPDMS